MLEFQLVKRLPSPPARGMEKMSEPLVGRSAQRQAFCRRVTKRTCSRRFRSEPE